MILAAEAGDNQVGHAGLSYFFKFSNRLIWPCLRELFSYSGRRFRLESGGSRGIYFGVAEKRGKVVEFRIPWRLPEPVRLPVYSSVEAYDPMLRSHCGLDEEPVIFPSFPDRRPESVV